MPRSEDSFGNPVSTYNGSVTVELAGRPGGNTLEGALTVQVQSGFAVFTDLSLNRAGLGYSLKVVGDLGLASTRTALFGVVPDLEKSTVEKLRLVSKISVSLKLHPLERRQMRHLESISDGRKGVVSPRRAAAVR